MKKIALVSAIALGSLFYNSANAQILQIGLRLGGHRPVVEASFATSSSKNKKSSSGSQIIYLSLGILSSLDLLSGFILASPLFKLSSLR